MKVRTRDFALAVVKIVSGLPKSVETGVLGRQLLRAGTSIGAQYREACRAKSDADFITKIEGCLQELEETRYWLELLHASNFINKEIFQSCDDEANQLISIFTTVVRRVKSHS
ncbi:MAG: four helix bundle protein [Calditrichaeota bacterium]|nr:four helix bundle protein [Calditrichota bacterium]